MDTYAIYSYEIVEGNKSLLHKETNKKTIDMAHEIMESILKAGITVIGKKRNNDMPLRNLNPKNHDGVFTWVLCNEKDCTYYEGHDKNSFVSHPGSYVIFDNRENVCQLAIEKNSAFDSDTDKVVKYLKRSLNVSLSDYGLQINISHKYQAGKFKEIIKERLLKNKDYVKKIVWEFPNPDKVKGIDADQQMKDNLEGMKLLVKATNALKGKLTLTGEKGQPLIVDDEKVEDLAQIIALCAQNSYNLSYHFYNSSTVSYKNAINAHCTIDSNLLREFENNEVVNYGEGQTYALIIQLDEIRKEIADYSNGQIIND